MALSFGDRHRFLSLFLLSPSCSVSHLSLLQYSAVRPLRFSYISMRHTMHSAKILILKQFYCRPLIICFMHFIYIAKFGCHFSVHVIHSEIKTPARWRKRWFPFLRAQATERGTIKTQVISYSAYILSMWNQIFATPKEIRFLFTSKSFLNPYARQLLSFW